MRGLEITRRIADSRCFFPMYPFGHRVSLTSSMGITSGLVATERRLTTSMDGRRRVGIVRADGIIVAIIWIGVRGFGIGDIDIKHALSV